MAEYPDILFRDGPAGRRPAVEGGPDVWEVVRVVGNVAESGQQPINTAAEWLGLSERKVEAAVRYYAGHRDAVEAEVAWRRGRA